MEKNKHVAAILIRIEVHEVLKTGELSGKPLNIEELKSAGLNNKIALYVEGFDKFECLKKLKEKIDGFKL